jgi:hypothetical protein
VIRRVLIGLAIATLGCSDDDPVRNAGCRSCGDAGDASSSLDAAPDVPDVTVDSAADAPADTGVDAGSSCLTHAAGVSVAETDLDGYPPYAVDGCAMAYVSTAGNLMLRDLTSGTEQSVAPAAEAPRRPTLSGGVLAWEARVWCGCGQAAPT